MADVEDLIYRLLEGVSEERYINDLMEEAAAMIQILKTQTNIDRGEY
jgi:hypothetical protein